MILKQAAKHFDPDIVEAFIQREPEFLSIRERFPDTHIPQGKPFTLPARDQADKAHFVENVKREVEAKQADAKKAESA